MYYTRTTPMYHTRAYAHRGQAVQQLDVLRMHYTCTTLVFTVAKPSSCLLDVLHMHYTCTAHVLTVVKPSSSLMHYTCTTHVLHMYCTRTYRGQAVQQLDVLAVEGRPAELLVAALHAAGVQRLVHLENGTTQHRGCTHE